MSYYFNRIINNKIKLSIILLVFFIPVLDIFFTLKDIQYGGSVPYPELTAFLGNIIFQGLQKLLLWYLPLILAIIVADDCTEDYKLGYKNLLISKWGKNKYFLINMAKGFIFSFFIILIPLLVNLVMTQFIFAGGTYIGIEQGDIESIPAMKEAFKNPIKTNIIYILVTVVFSGILGIGATAVSMALHNRFIVYPVIFILWYIPCSLLYPSIVCAFQPFTEYSLLDSIAPIILTLTLNLAAIAFGYIKVIKYDKV